MYLKQISARVGLFPSSWAAMPSAASSCVWFGNIPGYLDEPGALQELAAYGIRPYKLVLRPSRDSEEYFSWSPSS